MGRGHGFGECHAYDLNEQVDGVASCSMVRAVPEGLYQRFSPLKTDGFNLADFFYGLGVDTKTEIYKVCRLMCQIGFGE